MNWNLFVTELVAGITHGSVYALIALGYSMVYGILKLLNFAHGDVYMVGAFIGYGILTAFGGPTSLTISIPLLLALMFAGSMLTRTGSPACQLRSCAETLVSSTTRCPPFTSTRYCELAPM